MHHSFLKSLPWLSLLVGQIACAAVPAPLAERQYEDSFEPADAGAVIYVENRARANAVRDAFRFAWNGYKKVTWKNGTFVQDEVKPVTGGVDNSR
jgi:hypothetical protein